MSRRGGCRPHRWVCGCAARHVLRVTCIHMWLKNGQIWLHRVRTALARRAEDPRHGTRGRSSVAGLVFVLMSALVIVLVAAAGVVQVLQARRESEENARARSLGVAVAFAHAPGTAAALRSPDPTA